MEEEGYLTRIFSNAFVAFVPRFEVEGLIRARDLGLVDPKSGCNAKD
ncbi:unnamed protein product, partial [Tuber aestivum]